MFVKKTLSVFLLFILLFVNPIFADEIKIKPKSADIHVLETTQGTRYPDYAKMYVGEDKFEKFNRKMFNLNSCLNKYIARPVHILWASVMPKFGMDRISDVYNNIEYPKRLAGCIFQKDGKGVRTETIRFLTNTTLGLGGLFDPADKLLKIKPTNENMEQALCKCKLKSGSYLVMPVLNSCTPRSLCGRILEAALDPCLYLATPVTSIVKFGLMLNKTSYMQPLAKMIEMTYADPYDIHKKLFGIENYIRNQNLDRTELLIENQTLKNQEVTETVEDVIAELGNRPTFIKNDNIFTATDIANSDLSTLLTLGNSLKADLILNNYHPQTPIVDSMRTALFENPDIDKSFWNEFSVWNRSFSRRIKTGKIKITEGKPEYQFKYIMQKNKNSPVIIIYPSIGEGAGTHHSVVFAKMFHDLGYSVVMLGSHFHWEFVKSMPEGYYPGLPQNDAQKIRMVTSKILENLQNRYECNFTEKNIIGTSLGAMSTLFVAELENKDNILGINKFISICPPIELKYALQQLDKNGNEFDINSDEIKQKTAVTAAKILQMYELKKDGNLNVETMPFSDEEGKLITTFILRQKLSDLIFTLEKTPNYKKNDIYEMINNMNYRDYAEKYLGITDWNASVIDGNDKEKTSLFCISEYLAHNDNYRIYHALDDYLTNQEQLNKLKTFAGNHLKCLNCGAHLGFLYRKEFNDNLLADITNK